MAESNEPEVVHLKGEGGGVFRFECPLPPDIEKAYAKQALVRVNEDGTPYVEDAEPAQLTPKEKLQAEARELGVDDSGTVPQITERVEKRRALIAQAAEVGVEATGTDEEITARIDAKLAE
ncbi:hypothetical protein VA596_49895 [Amycolatopsis sp., V23-08]|uniref:Uncharacterized protein n=1 Tax=Amycolatopsis heterodermiae TaxID=3110235 RepID=A0ABU5RPB6_9PSEU|nr:hypothetical protein [Amycolatopsis sp., V23-08]MEA5367724.1 hypothetical protein [Amycolatopsis sp., V23-08]